MYDVKVNYSNKEKQVNKYRENEFLILNYVTKITFISFILSLFH